MNNLKVQAEESLKLLSQVAGQAPVALAVHVAAQNAAVRVRQYIEELEKTPRPVKKS